MDPFREFNELPSFKALAKLHRSTKRSALFMLCVGSPGLGALWLWIGLNPSAAMSYPPFGQVLHALFCSAMVAALGYFVAWKALGAHRSAVEGELRCLRYSEMYDEPELPNRTRIVSGTGV